MNHHARTGSFLLLSVLMGWHLFDQGREGLIWLALAVQTLVYPQLVFQLAKRAKDQLGAEICALKLDAFCFGIWLAALHFPLWIGFVLLISSLQNVTLFCGLRGLVHGVLMLLLGGALSVLGFGWNLEPHTTLWVTALSVLSISLYLLAVAVNAQRRLMWLFDIQQQMRAIERALQQQLNENRSLQNELREQARRDALTGLFNRRYLEEIIGHQLARCQREGQAMSLLLIDIDHFKRINDTYGHPVGDEVLRSTARLLGERVRASDMLFRYGGEEFLLVLLQADLAAATETAQNLRLLFADNPLSSGPEPVYATLSIGVSTFATHGLEFEELVQGADQALYRAKHAGRNRVEVAQAMSLKVA